MHTKIVFKHFIINYFIEIIWVSVRKTIDSGYKIYIKNGGWSFSVNIFKDTVITKEKITTNDKLENKHLWITNFVTERLPTITSIRLIIPIINHVQINMIILTVCRLKTCLIFNILFLF